MKNIFFAHGDSQYILKNLIKFHENEKDTNLVGILFSEKKLNLNYKNFDLFFYHKLIKKEYENNNCLKAEEIKYFKQNGFYDFIVQSDRVSIIPNSNYDIINHYYYLTEVFLEYFRKKSITHVIFQTTPHMMIDYIILNVANYLKLKKIIYYRTYYENQTLIASDFNFENNFFYENKSNICQFNLASGTKSIWNKLGSKINSDNTKLNLFSKILKYFIFILKRNYYTFVLRQVASTNFLDKDLNIFRFNILFIKHFFKFRKLSKYYKKLSLSGVKFLNKKDQKFIIFALHNQPEKTTQPEGLLFDNQLNAIKYLRQITPNEINLIIKEHPKQLNPLSGDIRQINSRSEDFYENILKLKNTYFIPIELSLNDIIDRSALNVTISGTFAWESIIKKIPSLTFGLTWHSDCYSSPHLSLNFEKDKEIVNGLLKKSKNDLNEDLKIFSEKISTKVFNICISDFEYEKTDHQKSNLQVNFQKALKDVI